jgi:hypothetical protein
MRSPWFGVAWICMFAACGTLRPHPAATPTSPGECASTSTSTAHGFDHANYEGNGYRAIAHQRDPEACANACDEDPRCAVASFYDSTASGGRAHTCVLRQRTGLRHPQQTGICSYVKRTSNDCASLQPTATYRFEAANYWNYELRVLDNQYDPEACARACAEDPLCWIASFHDWTAAGAWANRCVLRRDMGSRHPEQVGICSWVKN